MKYLFLSLSLLTLISCSKDDYLSIRELSQEEQLRVSKFEIDYVNKVRHDTQTKSESQDNVILIGYKTVAYHGSDSVFVNNLWETYKDEINAFESFLILDGQARIYFPLSDAIVRYNGEKYIADSNGMIACSFSDSGRVSVVGRNKTEKTIYTKFSHSYRPQNVFYNESVLVYDLGLRPLCNMNEHHLEKMTTGEGGSGGGVSCTKNHGSYPNCTVAYMIAQPRCVTSYDRCMDYNGFGTDCSGSGLYFIGSDCSVALSMGYCWNEVMD